MGFLYSSLHQPFGGWLKARRRVLSLSRSMVAEQTNYSVAMLKKVELGQRKPSVELATLLFEVLKVPLSNRDSFFVSAHSGITEPALQSLGYYQPAEPMEAALPAAEGIVHVPHDTCTISPPHPTTALVGREREVAAVLHMLKQPDHRLITLLGPPGVGKTRLAQAVAERVDRGAESGDQGMRVVFVSLAEERDARRLPICVAEALGIPAGPHLTQAIVAALHLRPGLIILDGIEHVLDGAGFAASFIGTLLAASPAVNIVVTSRISLHLSAEHTFLVEPLTIPNLDSILPVNALMQIASVKLFLGRIQFYNPRFQMSPANIYAAAHLCVALDGLPLALELAAARTNALNLRMLLAPFHSPTLPTAAATSPSILNLLTLGPRDLPERSRSLVTAIAWSYDLLRTEERRVFEGLARFPRGFTYAAAEAALGASVETLESLAAQSLIQIDVEADGELSFHMLKVLREYARLQAEAHALVKA